ncbi:MULTISPECIES: hypothetical protein [unclassified Lysobacter]|nr:hypothetical protein [Lysobacter sp. MMG2]
MDHPFEGRPNPHDWLHEMVFEDEESMDQARRFLTEYPDPNAD